MPIAFLFKTTVVTYPILLRFSSYIQNFLIPAIKKNVILTSNIKTLAINKAQLSVVDIYKKNYYQ